MGPCAGFEGAECCGESCCWKWCCEPCPETIASMRPPQGVRLTLGSCMPLPGCAGRLVAIGVLPCGECSVRFPPRLPLPVPSFNSEAVTLLHCYTDTF